MYYLTEIYFILLFIVLAGSITVDFAGYFDLNRKWTYTYAIVRSTTDISKSDVRKGRIETDKDTMAETDKEISSEKNNNEPDSNTHKTRFSVTSHFNKVTAINSETKREKYQNNFRKDTTSFSDENLDFDVQVTKKLLSNDREVRKPIVSGKISMSIEASAQKKKKKIQIFSDESLEIDNFEHDTKKTLKLAANDYGDKKPAVTSQLSMSFEEDPTTEKKIHNKNLQKEMAFSDENLGFNSQEEMTESVVTSPTIDRGVKKPIVTKEMSKSFEEYDITTEKKKHNKDAQRDMATFSDENREIKSEEHITNSVLTSPLIGRNVKDPPVTEQINWSFEEDETTTEKKRHPKDPKHDLTTLSKENTEIKSQEHITEDTLTSASIDRSVKKQVVTDAISWSLEDEATTVKKKLQKQAQRDLTTFSDENIETSSQEHTTKSVITSPSVDHGVKKPAATSKISMSLEEEDARIKKKKRPKQQPHDMTTFSDENLETNSQESTTESVLTSPSIGRNIKKQSVTIEMSKSVEEYESTTEKKKHKKDVQRDTTTFSDENLEKSSQEDVTESVITSPSIHRGDKKTEKKKYHKDIQRDMTTFSDENFERNSQEDVTESVITSPSIDRGVTKPVPTSKISTNLEEEDATTKKKKDRKKQRHEIKTTSDEYTDQEYVTEKDIIPPSKKDDIKKSTTAATTNISFEDETTTKKKKRYKKHKKTSKKIVNEPPSDSIQDTDMYSLEDLEPAPSSKKNEAVTKESQSVEKNLDTTTENVFNTMRPQYFIEKEKNVSAHTIEEDPQVKYFIGHILRSALRVFSNIKNKTKSPNLAAKLDLLADKYVARYNSFIDEIKKNKIKTALGTQKVLLSAIESSDHMMNRIVHFIVEDGANKDILRTSVNVANEFKLAINKETDDKYTYICRMMNICHSKSGFSNFLNGYITTILLCDDYKFAEAVKSFTEITKKMNYVGTFDTVARLNVLRAMKYIDSQDLEVQRIILKIFRNIVAYKNEPLKILKSDRAVNSTLAILEMLEAFETKLLRSDANIIIWGDLQTNLVQWANYKRNDIHDTMNNLMFYLKTALDDMPTLIKKRIAHNIGVIMNRKTGI